MIDGLHTQQRPVAHGFHLLHFRMSDVEAMLKNLWLSKHLIIHPHAIHTFDVSQVSEPDEGDEIISSDSDLDDIDDFDPIDGNGMIDSTISLE